MTATASVPLTATVPITVSVPFSVTVVYTDSEAVTLTLPAYTPEGGAALGLGGESVTIDYTGVYAERSEVIPSKD